jgi:hypothetical protein
MLRPVLELFLLDHAGYRNTWGSANPQVKPGDRKIS